MPTPSSLAIATQSVNRLVKEEAYYHKDLAAQAVRVEKLEGDIKAGSDELDENAEYVLKQEKQAMEETRTVFGPLRNKLTEAVAKLEEQIAAAGGEAAAAEAEAPGQELKDAQAALEAAREALFKAEA